MRGEGGFRYTKISVFVGSDLNREGDFEFMEIYYLCLAQESMLF